MEISAQIISIGNEIMLGHIANTNAQFISNKLTEIGIKTTRQIAIPDNEKVIISTIQEAISYSSIVITSGGLGPTADDLTLECIGKALNKKLILDKAVALAIKSHFKKRKLKMPKNNLRQAFIPEGAKPIINRFGTAPGLIMPLGYPHLPKNKTIVALPGVPFELYPMFEKSVLPYLKSHFATNRIIKSRIIKITGLPESRVNEAIEDILKLSGNIEMGIYPHPGEISVKITALAANNKSASSDINKIEKRIHNRLKNYIFGYDNETLEEVIGKKLSDSGKTLSIAESCTGGLLAKRITDVPGSSGYFKIGLIVYSNESKNKLLAIPMGTIKKYGAVSKNVAILMAKNVMTLYKTDIGIAITGIAGPKAGSKNKPVGLVYIALAAKGKISCNEFRFIGPRNIIRFKAAQAALNMLRFT